MCYTTSHVSNLSTALSYISDDLTSSINSLCMNRLWVSCLVSYDLLACTNLCTIKNLQLYIFLILFNFSYWTALINQLQDSLADNVYRFSNLLAPMFYSYELAMDSMIDSAKWTLSSSPGTYHDLYWISILLQSSPGELEADMKDKGKKILFLNSIEKKSTLYSNAFLLFVFISCASLMIQYWR